MDESAINIIKEPVLKEPALIEGLPGVGYVGKLAAEHLVEEFRAEKFAEMRSPHFPHHVQIDPAGVMAQSFAEPEPLSTPVPPIAYALEE